MPDAPLRLAMVAHDARKDDLIDWIGGYRREIADAAIFATGTTGGRIREACPELNVTALKSGPLGGDQQIGAMIAEGRLDALFFFIDPLSALPHDVDVKALTRLAVVYDLPLANSRATADLVMRGMLARRGAKG